MERRICPWARGDLYAAYHDREWGKPTHDDRVLFEMLILEGMQAGLSWLTVLKKREAFRAAFDGFDPQKVAAYTTQREKEFLENAEIIRNRAKIHAAVVNARQFLQIQEEFGSFEKYIWSFVDGKPIVNRWSDPEQMPARTETSDKMSRALVKRGFKFVGSTICYAYMQSVGMVNDHMTWCAEYARCQEREND